MTRADVHHSLATLFAELVYGAPKTGAYVLNRGDAGLLTTLDGLSAEEASTSRDGGASVAAHVEHLRYGLSLMNRWTMGENPFASADWSQAWKTGTVDDRRWIELRKGLREETDRWLGALTSAREWTEDELNGVIGSIVHLGYHLGAIRQIHSKTRGPKEQ